MDIALLNTERTIHLGTHSITYTFKHPPKRICRFQNGPFVCIDAEPFTSGHWTIKRLHQLCLPLLLTNDETPVRLSDPQPLVTSLMKEDWGFRGCFATQLECVAAFPSDTTTYALYQYHRLVRGTKEPCMEDLCRHAETLEEGNTLTFPDGHQVTSSDLVSSHSFPPETLVYFKLHLFLRGSAFSHTAPASRDHVQPILQSLKYLPTPTMPSMYRETMHSALDVLDALEKEVTQDIPPPIHTRDTCLKVSLPPFQHATVAWMREREERPFHLFRRVQEECYFSPYLNRFRERPFPAMRGGLLGNAHGSGKTVCLLALIASTQVPGRRTLIVAPTLILDQWRREIEEKTTLSVHIFHGKGRTNLNQPPSDIVLTTYGTLRQPASSVMLRGFYRTVFDDSRHHLQTEASRTVKHAFSVRGQVNWIVSSLFVLMDATTLFLSMRLLFSRMLTMDMYKVAPTCRALVSAIGCRFTDPGTSHEDVVLTKQTHALTLTPTEQTYYDTLSHEVGRSSNHCRDWLAGRPSKHIVHLPSFDDVCSVCLSVPTQPVATICNHIFCAHCLQKHRDSPAVAYRCPMCRVQLTSTVPRPVILAGEDSSESTTTVKLSGVHTLVESILTNRPSAKIVVVSTDKLLVTKLHNRNKHRSTMLQMAKALDQYAAATSILFASLHALKAGVNLGHTTHIVYTEPLPIYKQWPALMACLRMNRTTPLTQVNVYVENTIEEDDQVRARATFVPYHMEGRLFKNIKCI